MQDSSLKSNPSEKFKDLCYVIHVVNRNGKFYAMISELSIIVEDKDAGRALEKMEVLKTDYFEKMLAAGRADDIPLPKQSKKQSEFLFQIKIFLAKVIILCLFLGVTGIFVGAVIRDKIASFAGSKFAYTIVKNISNQIERLSDISDEQFIEERMKIAKGLVRLRVFLDDAHTILGTQAVSAQNPGGH